jgi:hypothetical protein
MDGKQHRGENDVVARRPPSLISAQGRETPLEVECCDSSFDENLSLFKVQGPIVCCGLRVVGCGLSRLNKGGKGKMKCSKRLEQLVWWWKKD